MPEETDEWYVVIGRGFADSHYTVRLYKEPDRYTVGLLTADTLWGARRKAKRLLRDARRFGIKHYEETVQ